MHLACIVLRQFGELSAPTGMHFREIKFKKNQKRNIILKASECFSEREFEFIELYYNYLYILYYIYNNFIY